MEFEVLTPDELVILRRVKTTKKQASQIKRRCKPLLKFLKYIPRDYTQFTKWFNEGHDGSTVVTVSNTIGCPHCHGCLGCAYTTLVEGRGFAQCTRVTFGGVTLDNTTTTFRYVSVIFRSFNEEILIKKVAEKNFDLFLQQLDEGIKFLAGHIEWADGVKTGEL